MHCAWTRCVTKLMLERFMGEMNVADICWQRQRNLLDRPPKACSSVAAFFNSLSPPSIQIQVLYDDIPGGGKGRATSTGQAHSQNRETRRSVTYKLFLAATWFQSEAGRGELLGMCQYRSHQDFSEACARNFIICWEHYSTFWCNWRHYSY